MECSLFFEFCVKLKEVHKQTVHKASLKICQNMAVNYQFHVGFSPIANAVYLWPKKYY